MRTTKKEYKKYKYIRPCTNHDKTCLKFGEVYYVKKFSEKYVGIYTVEKHLNEIGFYRHQLVGIIGAIAIGNCFEEAK